MPVSYVTCACLGGPNLNWMLITAGVLEGEPLSGGLFVTKFETQGLLENRFND
jgi:sugar lactone lactonase YvrE